MPEDNLNIVPDPSAGVGSRLRLAREERGLSRADIAAQTKIPERHLKAIEESRFADLASRAYAVGFSRTYARAVGLDEKLVADGVRAELGHGHDGDARPPSMAYEPVDPVRVPSSRTAWLAALAAFVLVIAGWLLWSQTGTDDVPAAPAAPAPAAAPAAGPVAVTLTALEDGVWIKVTDAAGAQLIQKEMARGESWTVPADAQGPVLRTAWPDALQVSAGDLVLPRLSDRRNLISDVALTADALRARATTAGPPLAAVPSAVPVPVSAVRAPERTATPEPAARPVVQPARSPAATPTPDIAEPEPAPASAEASTESE